MKISIELIDKLINIEKEEAVKDKKEGTSSGFHLGAILAYENIKRGLTSDEVKERYTKGEVWFNKEFQISTDDPEVEWF